MKSFYLKSFFLFWMTFTVFVSPRPTVMANAMLQTSVNIVEKHSMQIPYNYMEVSQFKGSIYASFGPGTWACALPYYVILRPLISRLPEPPILSPVFKTFRPLIDWLKTKQVHYLHIFFNILFMYPLTATLLVQLERYAIKKHCSKSKAFGIASLCGFGTILFPLVGTYTAQACASLLVGNALLWQINRDFRLSPLEHFLNGLLLSSALCVDYASLFAVGCVGILLLWNVSRPSKTCLLGGLFVVLLCMGYYHYLVTGSPFKTPYHNRVARHADKFFILYKGVLYSSKDFQAGTFLGLNLPQPTVLGKLLFSRFRGILIYCPLLILAILGHLRSIRKRIAKGLSVCCLSVAIIYLLFNSSLKHELYWSGIPRFFGPRYLIPIIIPLYLGLVFIEVKGLGRYLVGILAGLSFWINLVGVIFQPLMLSIIPDNAILFNPIFRFSQLYIWNGPRIPILTHFFVSQYWQAATTGLILGMWTCAVILLKGKKRKI